MLTSLFLPFRPSWLAQAELSTYSRSPRILPRPIYLSHQFAFHTLGEDYHALIRRYQFDIGIGARGHKIEVRREVQASAYPAGGGESFVEGFSAPRDMRARNRTLSSSFDEPLASALAAGLEYPHAPSVLPMLPNGTPQAQGFRRAIPIRGLGLGDGVSEGLGRIRREMQMQIRGAGVHVRSPRPDSSGGMGMGMGASVPLEFDEEDEDFLGGDALGVPALDRDAGSGSGSGSGSRGTSRGGAGSGSGSGASVLTPGTSTRPLDEEEDDVAQAQVQVQVEDAWGGWSVEDRLAVEEAERFDDISVVGFLDEEQAAVAAAVVRPVGAVKKKGRGRRR